MKNLYSFFLSAYFTFYFLVPVKNLADLSKTLGKECDQSSMDSVRKSLDGTSAVLSYSNKTQPQTLLDYQKENGDLVFYDMKTMQQQLKSAEWTPQDTLAPCPCKE